MMDDFPEELWVEMDGGLVVIHNHDPKLPALIDTGHLKKYVPAPTVKEKLNEPTL